MSSPSSVMGPTVVTWVGGALTSVQCDGSYCSDLGGDPEVDPEVSSQSSVMGPTAVTWVGALRCPVSPV